MKIINEIIESATASDVRLPIVLRKCLVLASKLKNDGLKEWCLSELDGFADKDNVPNYRVFPVQSQGLLLGPFGAKIPNQPLPLSVLKKEHFKMMHSVRMTEPIAEIEVLANSGAEQLASPWSADMVALYADKFIEGYSLNRAYRVISPAKLIGICDTVRNRILRLSLELSEQVGETEDPLQNISMKEVDQKVTNYIFGGQNVIGSTVSGSVNQANQGSVIAGDYESLEKAILELGIPKNEVHKLKEALEVDTREHSDNNVGPNTRSWIQSSARWIGRGTAALGGAAGGDLLAQYIKIYLNID